MTSAPRVRSQRVLDQTASCQFRDQPVQIGEAKVEIDFRDLLLKLALVPLNQAPDCHDRLDRPVHLQFRGVQDGLDGLSLGGVNEPAGVDQDDVGAVRLGSDLRPVAHQLAHQPLGVHRRFVAAERNDGELHER